MAYKICIEFKRSSILSNLSFNLISALYGHPLPDSCGRWRCWDGWRRAFVYPESCEGQLHDGHSIFLEILWRISFAVYFMYLFLFDCSPSHLLCACTSIHNSLSVEFIEAAFLKFSYCLNFFIFFLTLYLLAPFSYRHADSEKWMGWDAMRWDCWF